MKSFFQGLLRLLKTTKDISGVIWWFVGLTGISTTFLVRYWQSPALSWSVEARPLLIAALVLAICVLVLIQISSAKDARIKELEGLLKIEVEKSKAKPGLCSSDVELAKKMEHLFDRRIYAFLREQDMGAPFVREYLDPIFKYTDTWKGPHFDFIDPELEEVRARFRKAMVKFSRNVAMNTTYNGRFVSMDIRDMEHDPELLKIRDDLNQEGHDVADLLEEFVKVSRRRKSESEKK